MDVLFVSSDDWANVGALCAKACRYVGLDSESLVSREHDFAYPTKSRVVTDRQSLKYQVRDARAVVFMHSVFPPDLTTDLKRQKVAVFHGGTKYRIAGDKIAKKQNPRVSLTFLQDGTLFGKGAKNETLLIPPVDEEFLKPVGRTADELRLRRVFGHFPRAVGNGAKMKGTTAVREAATVLHRRPGCAFRSSTDLLPWRTHMARIAEVDVYIEKMGLSVREWGMAALEAAALGMVVVTNWEHMNPYRNVFGDTPLRIANNVAEMKRTLIELATMDAVCLAELRVKTAEWAVRVHGLKATGKYIAERLGL